MSERVQGALQVILLYRNKQSGYDDAMSDEPNLNDYLEYTILADECRPEVKERVEKYIEGNRVAYAQLANLKGMFCDLDGVPLRTALDELRDRVGGDETEIGRKNNESISQFIEWLDGNDKAQEVLNTLGILWK